MECDKCGSNNLEIIIRKVEQRFDIYYSEMEDYEKVDFRCNECGHEFAECI